jgi:leader peptidase (prepilin peptidase)/N-methyltransferase
MFSHGHIDGLISTTITINNLMLNSIHVLSTALPWFFPVLIFIVGACVGSFLNVCIYRIPAGRSVVRPGSHCACGAPIAWYDNIPVLSWFVLRGRSRCCKKPYSFRYPFIEFLTAMLFLACWLLFSPAKVFCGMVFVSALICATFIDLDHFEIPDVFTIGLAVAGVILSCVVPSLHGQAHEAFVIAAARSCMLSVSGLLAGSALLLWIALLAETVLRKEAMGFGDVKFLGAIGAFCGWQGALVSIFGGAILGIAGLALMMIANKIRGKKFMVKALDPGDGDAEIQMTSHVPYGPMLAAGALVHFLWLHRWIDPHLMQIMKLIWS